MSSFEMEKETILTTENSNLNEKLDNADNNKNKLKVLVFGVGVIGSLMIHYLCEAGNDVTVIARSTYEELKKNGLVIEHCLQKKTTIDHPTIIKEVDLSEKYDIVFSVMQSQQQLSLLDTLSKLNTKLIVFVGNNVEADKCDSYINEHKISERHVLFGFQSSAGHREGGKAIVARFSNTTLYLGGLHSLGNPDDIKLINKALNIKEYKIYEQEDMYAYYLYHITSILPLAYLSYKYDCDLKKATSNDIKLVMKATSEAMELLKLNKINPMPIGEDTYYSGIKKKFMYLIFRTICKTKYGKLMISDHCHNAVPEIKYFDEIFEKFRRDHINKDMPTWDTMRKWNESIFN